MNNAKAALVVAIFAILFGLAGLAAAAYCLLWNRDLTGQLADTQTAIQTLADSNRDLSDQLEKLQPGGSSSADAGARRGGAPSGKIPPDLAIEIRNIEGRINDLDGGGGSHLGIKWQVSELQTDLSRLDAKIDDLARRR